MRNCFSKLFPICSHSALWCAGGQGGGLLLYCYCLQSITQLMGGGAGGRGRGDFTCPSQLCSDQHPDTIPGNPVTSGYYQLLVTL